MVQDECIYTDAIDAFTGVRDRPRFLGGAPVGVGEDLPEGDGGGRPLLANLRATCRRNVERVDRDLVERPERPIDIGYRAWGGPPSFGRHGLLRRRPRTRSGRGRRAGCAPTSTDLADTITGDDWFRFLALPLRDRRGGRATVLDGDGTFKRRTERYLAAHPDASYEEVEAACFPARTAGCSFSRSRPATVEACATRTCQVLVEGDYSGVLGPASTTSRCADFSNLADVLDQIESDEHRGRLTQAAYRDVPGSGRYSYERFVDQVERAAAEGLERKTSQVGAPPAPRAIQRRRIAPAAAVPPRRAAPTGSRGAGSPRRFAGRAPCAAPAARCRANTGLQRRSRLP